LKYGLVVYLTTNQRIKLWPQTIGFENTWVCIQQGEEQAYVQIRS